MNMLDRLNRLNRLHHKPRAFVLVIVLLVALAAAAVAIGLTSTGGEARIRSIHAEHADLSEGIAHAGLQRAKGYANASSPAGGDFDALLDPGFAASCLGLPAVQPTCATCNRPDFSDGSAVTYLGKSYEMVPFNGGAYLIRIEDDTDDQQIVAQWALSTSNNVAPSGCIEGPLLLGADNPVRDRNRTVMITVIGISPGTDPNTAQHRTVLRLLHSNNSANTGAGIVVRGSVDVSGSAQLFACSPVGHMQVDGALIGPGGGGDACACGNTVADSLDSWDHCTEAAMIGNCAGVGCAPGALGTPGPATPDVEAIDGAVGKNTYFEWDEPCTFFIEHGGAAATSLWVWDPAALRGPGGVACSTITADATLAWPVPPDPSSTGDYRSCWTPLVLRIDAGCPDNLWGGENGASCGWAPNNDVNTLADAAVNPAVTAAGFPAYPAGSTIRKPAFGTECTVSYPSQPPNLSCTGSCDGTNTVFAENPGPAPYWFVANTAATIRAVPAGVYIYSAALDIGSTDMTGPFPNTTPPLDLTQFPLATIASTGAISGSGTLFLGTGTDKDTARFPSIITNGAITFNGGSNKAYAGSLWSRGSMNWNGSSTMHLFGEIHLNGSWILGGNGTYHWRYTTTFGTASGGATGTPALVQSFE